MRQAGVPAAAGRGGGPPFGAVQRRRRRCSSAACAFFWAGRPAAGADPVSATFPLNASGGETDVGTVNATCTLNADQNTVLGVIRYHPVNSLGRPAPDPTVSGGSPGPATVRKGSPSPSASSAVVVLMVPPAPPSVVRRDGGSGSSLFEIPIATLLILPGMVTAIVCAVAFVAFKAGRLTR
jgi:hypothetical protein